MLNMNKPVQTRDGRKARIIATDKKGDYPIVALIDDGSYDELTSYTKEGLAIINCETERDLTNVLKKRYAYINVYKNVLYIYESQLGAERCEDGNLIAKMKVEIDETRQDW